MNVMNKIIFMVIFMGITICSGDNRFSKLHFLIGEWTGTGQEFGNETSVINSFFLWTMDSMYIEVENDSRFKPGASKPDCEHHIDRGANRLIRK